MWKLCLVSLLAASASALRGFGVVNAERPSSRRRRYINARSPSYRRRRHEHHSCAHATENATENATETHSATCGPFPGRQVVLVTVNSDFMPFFQNWLHYAGPFLTSSEQVVAFAEDEKVIPMLRDFLHNGTQTPFKIAIPAPQDVRNVTPQDVWNVTAFADRSHGQDVYEIHIQDIHPWGSTAYKTLVSQRPRQIRYFLEEGCSVLYVDIDTAWVKNPFREISRAGNFEMYVTDDSALATPAGLQSDNLCSCFLYMHPTSNVKAVMSRWEFLLKGELQRNQARFTQAVHEIMNCFPHFAVTLPRREFPPGGRNFEHPTVLHANYLAGEQKKREFLKKHHAWSLD